MVKKSSSAQNIFSGSIWGILAKVIDALAKFVTIPMLVGYFGKADYGLIALAFSLNTYLRLMDMGMNVGSIRFFSMWLSTGELKKIEKVSSSSIVFYGAIGIVNALIFAFLAQNIQSTFNISGSQAEILKWILYILAISTIFNWLSNVVNQLLVAAGELGWVNRVTIVSSILNFVTAFVAIQFKLSLPVYFVLYTLSTLVIIPFNIYRLGIFGIPRKNLLKPKWDWSAFSEIFRYGLAILAMGVFQFSADNLRPIILGIYASGGVEVLTEYRVLQTVTMLVMSIGVVFRQSLLPSTSRIFAENNRSKIEDLVYNGTKYISLFISFLVFGLITNSKLLLTLYMGEGYSHLSTWLTLWLLTVLLTLHKSPIDSLILSTGKTKFLVYSSAISCLITLPITIYLAPKYNVGAAVIGYLVYVVIEVSGYYIYLIKHVLDLDSFKIFFKSFLPTLLVGLISWAVVYIFFSLTAPHFKSQILLIILQSIVYCFIFGVQVLLFVVKKPEIQAMYLKLSKSKTA